jgi:hypothetical protein
MRMLLFKKSFLLSLSLLSVLFLQTLTAANDWGKAGLTLVDSNMDNNLFVTFLKDKSDRPIEVRSKQETIDSSEVSRIKTLCEKVFNIPGIKPKKLLIQAGGEVLEGLLMTESVVIDGKDISQSVNNGILFIYGGTFVHDFRINVKNILVRIRGRFDSGEILTKKMLEAWENPELYAKKNDPDYFSDRLGNHDEQLIALNNETEALRKNLLYFQNVGFLSPPKPVDEKALQRVLGLKRADTKLTLKEVAEKCKTEGLKINDQEIKLIFSIYFNELK